MRYEASGDPALYRAHLQTLSQRYSSALAATGYDAVLIGAGILQNRFLDDQAIAFRSNPQLLQWLPLAEEPGAMLLFRPGIPPLTVVIRTKDYWHQAPPLPGPPWSEAIELRIAADGKAAVAALETLPGRLALLGPADHWQAFDIQGDVNPPALIHWLHYQRAVKTEFEVACLRTASLASAAGHRAAGKAFAGGETEFGILLAFLAGAGQTADELPYPAIVAGDAHAAVLHYQHYERLSAPGGSLLIDAGAGHLGYAADVTRTHARASDGPFAGLLQDMDHLQQSLCQAVRPGVPFADLHHAAHEGIARVLHGQKLVRASADALLETGVTRLFFPHGLGHLLGLQVHDVGGHQAGPGGDSLPAPAAYPKLRLLRALEPGFTLTIEPGLYFIDSLLGELRRHALASDVNWAAIDELRPRGGIRIEDNLLVTADGSENLTRAAFAA